MPDELPRSEIVLYQIEDGCTHIECSFENETIRLTQAPIAELSTTSNLTESWETSKMGV